jgi:hypothetical protein
MWVDRRKAMAVAVAVSVWLLVSEAAQAAIWTSPFDVPSSTAAALPQVVADNAGNATLAWVTEEPAEAQVFAATRPVDGAPVTTVISAADRQPVGGVSLAGDPSGRIAAAWSTVVDPESDAKGIDVAVGNGGALGAAEAVPAGLLAGGATDADIAVSAGGDVVLAFTDMRDRMHVLTRRASDGQFVGTQTFAPAATGAEAADPEISVSADGRAAVVWQESREQSHGSGDQEVTDTTTYIRMSRRVSGDPVHPFEAPSTLIAATETVNPDETASGESVQEPQIGTDDDGGTAVAFTRTTQLAGGETTISEVLLSTGSVAAGLGAPAPVSAAGQNADDTSLALSPSGAGVVAWTIGAGAETSVQASRRAPGGAFSGAETVAAAASMPAATVRASGMPVIAYVTAMRVLAVAGTLEGYEAPVSLGPADPPSDEPALAADSRGGALAAWRIDPDADPEGDQTLRAAALQPDPSQPQPESPQPQPEPPQPEPSQPLVPSSPPGPSPGPPGPTTGQSADTTPPTITGLRMLPDIFWVAGDRSPVHAARHLPRGSTLRFRLSEGAWVRITISRETLAPGPRRSRCQRPSDRQRDRRAERVGILRDTYTAGVQRVRISGRIGRRPLSRGRYVIRLRASDRVGNLSSITATRFTVC